MTRTTIWTLVLSLALATAAAAAPTPEEKCQAAKLKALGKRKLCLKLEQRKGVLGKTPDPAKCGDKFVDAIGKADEAAAKKGASCRWLDNEDGTATDLNSGLQWELKTDDGSVHDKDDMHTWNTTAGGTTPDGTAFTAFLGTLDGGVSADGVTATGCFAGHCDWRLPTIEELRGIRAGQDIDCTIDPCTTIPGLTLAAAYWTSSTVSTSADRAWLVGFNDGGNPANNIFKVSLFWVRAVRGGS